MEVVVVIVVGGRGRLSPLLPPIVVLFFEQDLVSSEVDHARDGGVA